MTKRVLSGMRPTGKLHLGNYLGAAKGMIELQNKPEYETFYMVADVHGITTPFDPKEFGENRYSVIIDYLAAGLDPKKATLFLQSQVGEHLEFMVYLSSVVTVARMLHLPTYKEKIKQYPESVTMALLNYPVLMASDILIYKADQVPVGIDQEPHIEVAREIARKINSLYGTSIPEPQRFSTNAEYVPSLTGEGKMAKSVEGSYINMTDDLNTIKERLAKVATDSGKRAAIPLKGSLASLLMFVELFEGKAKKEEYEQAYMSEGIKYQQLKEDLAAAIDKEVAPIREKRIELEKDMNYIKDIVNEGSKKASIVARQTLDEVKTKMGFN